MLCNLSTDSMVAEIEIQDHRSNLRTLRGKLLSIQWREIYYVGTNKIAFGVEIIHS